MPLDLNDFEATPTTRTLRVDDILETLDRDDPDSAANLRTALTGNPRQYPAERIARKVREEYDLSLSPNAVRLWRSRNG